MTVLADHKRDIEASAPPAGRLWMRIENPILIELKAA
jgi:hypothetical protein